MEMPHFNVVVHVPFERMYDYIKMQRLHFTSTVVYLVSKAANAVPELRWRIREGQVVEHEVVHPSFSVQIESSDVFSFCYVEYQPDFYAFSLEAKRAIQLMQTAPSLEDHPDRDDYLFLSPVPWVHFTGMSHAMRISQVDSVPRITWGKFGPGKDGRNLPLSIQAHHAVVDGKHAGQFLQLFEELCADPEAALS